MFTNYNLSPLRQHTVTQPFSVFYPVQYGNCLVIQPYFNHNINTNLLLI